MSESYVHLAGDRVTAYVGDDAVHLLRAKMVISALKAIKAGFRLTRTAPPKRTLQMATEYTGKKYKMGEYDRAIEDVRQWCLAMEAALPVVKD